MPIALHKRLNWSQEELRERLQHMYQIEKKSQAKIAECLGCDTTCIEGWFRRLELETRSQSEVVRNIKSRRYIVSKEQLSALQGLILSDLHIERSTFQARASFGFKHKEFARAVIKATNIFEWSQPRYNQKTLGWHSKTKYCINLHNEHRRWYLDRKKIIPSDITIDSTMLLWWYLGDGYLAQYGAVLCTDSFSKEENEKLVHLINSEGIPSHLTPRNRIRIEGSSGFNKFIDYIGPSPVECYKYKWGER